MRLILLLSLIVASASAASAQSTFYKGQTITIIAGANAGSTYDLYVRLVARHMGKYIPGNPNFIVQNMGGGEELEGLAKQVMASQEPEVIERVKKLLGE